MMAGSGRSTAVGGPARHHPVMLSEVIQALEPKDGAIVIDGTFGAGGYTKAILDSADCKVIAIDRDPDAIVEGAPLAALFGGRLMLVNARYSDMDAIAAALGLEAVDGVALDLGVSSMQLDRSERGFSFMKDAPLDMRMGKDGPTAADIVNTLSEKELAGIIGRLGEERRAGVTRRRRRGLAQRAVGVEGLEVEAHGRLLHAMNPVAATASVTCLRDLAGSSGAGAGRLPAMCRIQAAWRASTDTTDAAAGSVLRRSRGPWPL